MHRLLPLFVGSLLLLWACDQKSCGPLPGTSHLFSFEKDMEQWQIRGIDLELGDTLVAWSIQRTQEIAADGSTAVRFYLENYNDAGKIWIQRLFAAEPNSPYDVHVVYAFASADFGMANLWTLITGVVPQSPQSRDDLVYQGHTGNGSDTDVGFQWLIKEYDFSVCAGSDGQLYVLVGIWGTWETPRTYYLDSLAVSFTKQ